MILETWNEFHEGTNIAESREHGRQYIELTRKYVDLFKQGKEPPPVAGPFHRAASVEVVLGQINRMQGIKQVDSEDGHTVPSSLPASHAVRRAGARTMSGTSISRSTTASSGADDGML